MTDGERIDALEERLQALEDERAIYRLMASYGPAADSNSLDRAGALWTEDGIYDVDVGRWQGPAEIAAMLAGDFHQESLASGCAHQVSVSRVTVDGDRAVVTGYLQLVIRGERFFEIRRQTAQRWELARTAAGWRIAHRTGRLIDGSEPARALLRAGLED